MCFSPLFLFEFQTFFSGILSFCLKYIFKNFLSKEFSCHHHHHHEQPLVQYSSVQSLSHIWLFATPWTAVHQASLSITNSQSPPKPMSIELVMPSNHLILCHPLLLLPSIFPGIRVFSNESTLHISWPKYWSFSFNISPSNEHPGLTLKSLLQHHSSKASIL